MKSSTPHPDPLLRLPRVISAPDAFVRVTQQRDGTLLFVAPRPDPLGKLAKAFGQLSRAIGMAFLPGLRQMVAFAAEADRVLARLRASMEVPQYLRDEANALPRIAGLEARYYMRGSLDQRYRTPAALHSLVRTLLAGDREYDPDLAFVTPENRRQLAVAAMRGWSERPPAWREDGPAEPPLILHRAWPLTHLVVRCG